MASFPIAPQRPKEITQHGQTRVDPYFWMCYREDPEVLKYLHAEQDYLEEVMPGLPDVMISSRKLLLNMRS